MDDFCIKAFSKLHFSENIIIWSIKTYAYYYELCIFGTNSIVQYAYAYALWNKWMITFSHHHYYMVNNILYYFEQ